jgi:large subunit ribosomal protein L23
MTAFNLFKKEAPKKKSAKQAEIKVVEKTETPAVKVASLPALALASSILHPYVSEKATRLEGINQYVFKVTPNANKPEVKKAVQNHYKVSVVNVRMINMPSKTRTVGRHVGTKSGFRKAIVTLAEGDSINSAKA